MFLKCTTVYSASCLLRKKKSKIVEATGLYLTEFSKTKEHAIYFEEIKVYN